MGINFIGLLANILASVTNLTIFSKKLFLREWGLSLSFIFAFGHLSIRFHIVITHCSGQAAVITPRQVTSGLGSRRVMAIAAAKHHTVIATEGGDVFTWGSNRGI